MKKRELTCIVCPRGCALVCELDDGGKLISVSGNLCPRGKKYADDERFLFVKYTDRGHSVYKGGGADFDAILLNRIIAFFNKHK